MHYVSAQYFTIILYIFSLLCCGSKICAQPVAQPFINISARESIAILPHAELFIDETHALKLSDVLQERITQAFTPFHTITNPRYAYWLRFRLENTDSVPHRRYVQVGASLIDSAMLYHSVVMRNNLPVPSPTAWDSSVNGSTIAFAKRPLPLKGNWHILTIPPHSVELVFVRIATHNGLTLDMMLHDDEQFRQYRDGAITFYSIIAGMMLFAMVYNFVIAISTRDKAYFFYVFHTAVWFFGGVIGFFPIVEQHFPNVEFLTTKLQLGLLVVGGLSTTLFALQFLNVRHYTPRIYIFMLGNIIVQSIACAIIATPAYTIVSMILNVSFVPGAAALIIAAFAAWRQGYTPARLYLLGWGLYLVGVITSILSLVGIIEYSELRAIRLLWIGVAMETVIFSFALIERMNTIRRALAQEQQQRVLADKEREREHERTLEIERHNSELERTNEIVTRQAESIQQANVLLKQQNARLEEFNHEKNEMLAMVSHDLKNPLAALRGIAELLQAEGRDSTLWKSALLQMMATTDRMLALVKNLLDVNRLETEGINYTAIPVFVEAIINETVALYNKQATAKGIHILSDTSKTYTNENNVPIMALADEQALTQVLDNLVSNALKYSPYRASVFVSAFAYDAEKADISDLHKHNLKCYDMLLPQCMVISVKDQGPGISVKDQAQLFGKFRRLSAQPTGGEHSTGLGLSIVKKIVDGMNGRVWCESDFGYGATFFVVLPLA